MLRTSLIFMLSLSVGVVAFAVFRWFFRIVAYLVLRSMYRTYYVRNVPILLTEPMSKTKMMVIKLMDAQMREFRRVMEIGSMINFLRPIPEYGIVYKKDDAILDAFAISLYVTIVCRLETMISAAVGIVTVVAMFMYLN